MHVSGVRPYAGFYQYNSIKLNELRSQQVQNAALASASLENPDTLAEDAKRLEEEIAVVAARQTFDSYDFAQQYMPNETYELKGVDSEISSLDVEKAVSDLDKDQMLQQYQYFVGNQNKVTATAKNPEALTLRTGENFTL